MIKIENGILIEDSYTISSEAKSASIFSIGNGYYGIRGSFEEFGDVFVQGCYIRGVFDQIVEIPVTLSDNSYMKKYYFDAQKLKEFEYEDCCINIADIQAYRIYINGKLYLPWDYKITSYKRYIDYSTGALRREMIIEDSNLHHTRLSFYKCASFKDDHLFIQQLTIEKLDHDDIIEVRSGVDVLVKTNGQHKSQVTSIKRDDKLTTISLSFGDKYNIKGDISFKDKVEGGPFISLDDLDQVYSNRYLMDDRKACFRKKVYFKANIDQDEGDESILDESYDYLLSSSTEEFSKLFKRVDIKIVGNDKLDALLRYASYQTLIGINRKDSVHSLSAKNLTAEKYNQFVWWDCEIYQMPFFLLTMPEYVKNLLEYRYKCLPQAFNNAEKEGRKGAKFAFCSSIDGRENVWIYAKHPFMQIHINSDIAYAILNYYKHTGDKKFLEEKGLKMIDAILLYMYDRATFRDGKYHLEDVTGTDEHHDYVRDDAYTNISLKYVLKEYLRLTGEFKYESTYIKEDEAKDLLDKLYLPKVIDGVIEQFDGYFNLSRDLPIEGESTSSSSFQMKSSGLYHLSQIIKQPDVLLLFTLLDIDDVKGEEENYSYYLQRCEASSSLTYPVHAIASIDCNDKKEFYSDLLTCLSMDIDDIYKSAALGLHAGALAGGYISIVRGLLGIKIREDRFIISPKKVDEIKEMHLQFIFKGEEIKVDYYEDRVELSSEKKFSYEYKGCLDKDVYKTIINL